MDKYTYLLSLNGGCLTVRFNKTAHCCPQVPLISGIFCDITQSKWHIVAFEKQGQATFDFSVAAQPQMVTVVIIILFFD